LHPYNVTPRPTPSGEGWRWGGSLGRAEEGPWGEVLVRGTGRARRCADRCSEPAAGAAPGRTGLGGFGPGPGGGGHAACGERG
jgi:hypothetical protein